MKKILLFIILSYSMFAVAAGEESTLPVTLSSKDGITIVGDQELPQVLYLIPWKSPELSQISTPEFMSNKYVEIIQLCDLPSGYWQNENFSWACKFVDVERDPLLR